MGGLSDFLEELLFLLVGEMVDFFDDLRLLEAAEEDLIGAYIFCWTQAACNKEM